jgi:hypothetical protein
MADKRISQLVERTDIANNDVVPIVASGATTTNKATISSIQEFMQENLDLGVTSVGITLGTTGTDVSVSGSPITTSGNITINLPTASATNRGLLSSADWTTFNNKQAAGNYVTLDTAQNITAPKGFINSGGGTCVTLNHTSGSGVALDIIKAGNNEAIRVTKTSGSGNAMTISGGNFEAGTIVKTGGTSSQFLMADGSVNTSVSPSGAYLPLTGGTLTGALNGTSALFSGALTANGGAEITSNASTVGLKVFGGGNLNIDYLQVGYSGGSASPIFRITYTGAATFSSSVTAASLNVGSGTLGRNAFSQSDFRIAAPNDTNILNGIAANSSMTIKSDNYGGGSATPLILQSGANNNQLYLATSGNVGIGTASPKAILSSANTGALTLDSNDGNHTGFGLFIQAPSTINTVNSAIGFGQTSGRKLAAIGMQTYADPDQAGLNFYVQPIDAGSTADLTEAMRITSAGLVGIGTDSPASILHTYKSNSSSVIGKISDAQLLLDSGDYGLSTYKSQIAFGYFTGSFSYAPAAIGFIPTTGSASGYGDLTFSTRNVTTDTAPTERMRINSVGSVFIGCTSDPNASTNGIGLYPNGEIDVSRSSGTSGIFNRNTTTGDILDFRYNNSVVGSISTNGTTTSYNITSDYRLKEDLKEIHGLKKIQAIKVYNYKWKSEDSRMDGVLAHELAEVLPYAVHGEKDEVDEEGNDKMQGVDYSKIVPILIKAIQEQQEQIDSLKNQIK